MSYAVEFSDHTRKAFNRLDQSTKTRIAKKVEDLSNDPFDPRTSKPLRGLPDLRAARVGGWRICYTLQEQSHTLYIVSIERRGQVYKRL